jgi:uncharacterized protein YprB with RNaseH-like and TPR domain
MTLTALQRERALSLRSAGVNVRDIARQVDAGYGTVRYFLDRNKRSATPFIARVWDIETTNLKADIGILLVAAFLDLNDGTVESRTIDDFEGTVSQRERQLARWAREQYVQADLLIGHNSLAFDKNFLNGVVARHNLEPLPLRVHADTYLIARYGLKGLMGYSLSNLADVFGVGVKDLPSKNDWREANAGDPDSIKRLRHRCICDVVVTAAVWNRLKGYWAQWKGAR